MILFTTGDVLELSGIAPNTFDRWCVEGIVEPVSGGAGTGNHRQWTLMQTIGFVVAEKIRQSDQGCVPAFVGKVVEAFAAVDDEESLLKQMKQDGRFFVMPHQGKPHFQGDGAMYGWPDVLAAHKLVTAHAKKKQSRTTKKR